MNRFRRRSNTRCTRANLGRPRRPPPRLAGWVGVILFAIVGLHGSGRSTQHSITRLAADTATATTSNSPVRNPSPVDLPGPCRPGAVLDLSRWKLTLPTGVGSKPTQVLPINLGQVIGSPFFQANPTCNGIVFRAPVTGVTTPGSHYPRSELREMSTANAPASWSSTLGTHWLGVYEAFTALPRGKPELVGAQIHDATSDISVFRLEGSRLWITNGNNPHYQLVTDQYQLGTVFAAGYLVTHGQIGAYYNGRLVAQISRAFTNAYFKAGAYTQANCTNAPCDPNNFGETVIYALTTSHS